MSVSVNYDSVTKLVSEFQDLTSSLGSRFSKVAIIPPLPEYKDIVSKRQLYDVYRAEVERNSELRNILATITIKEGFLDEALTTIAADKNLVFSQRSSWNIMIKSCQAQLGRIKDAATELSRDLNERLRFMYSLGFLSSSVTLSDIM